MAVCASKSSIVTGWPASTLVPQRKPGDSAISASSSLRKAVLEDVCDNLFNPDPYQQQGGDMVRVGGLSYRCAPAESIGRRITELTRDDGKPLAASKRYKVAGWASMNAQTGKPVWDVVADHLRAHGAPAGRASDVVLSGVDGNPGISEPS
jgi:sulfur-oxidizing protein SoxB